jgi:hypothetical protein
MNLVPILISDSTIKTHQLQTYRIYIFLKQQCTKIYNTNTIFVNNELEKENLYFDSSLQPYFARNENRLLDLQIEQQFRNYV